MRWCLFAALCLGLAVSSVGCSLDDYDDGEPCGIAGCKDALKLAPGWTLEDVQPASTRFRESYGLSSYRGKPVVVAFLVGWCPYCRQQAIKLEQLQGELGQDAQIVILHGATADKDEDRAALIYMDPSAQEKMYRTTLPIFQDKESVDAWGLHGGVKDDLFVYDAQGRLFKHMRPADGTDLSTDAGYANLKQAIEDAAM